MARHKVPTIYFRRRREGKTDYRKRLKLLLSGKQRLVVRLTSRNVRAQIISFTPTGDKVLVAAESKELEKHGWNFSKSNLPAAYLLGVLIGKKAMGKKVTEAILDKGISPTMKGSKMFAVLKGAVDAGLNVPYSENILPSDERVSGKHIADYAKALKGDKEAFQKEFSAYLKKNVNPEDIEANFSKTKETLLKV
jgi:large subunit ribosomal protein L18